MDGKHIVKGCRKDKSLNLFFCYLFSKILKVLAIKKGIFDASVFFFESDF